jgi:hypothetical protein
MIQSFAAHDLQESNGKVKSAKFCAKDLAKGESSTWCCFSLPARIQTLFKESHNLIDVPPPRVPFPSTFNDLDQGSFGKLIFIIKTRLSTVWQPELNARLSKNLIRFFEWSVP